MWHEDRPWIHPKKLLWKERNGVVDADRIVSVSGYPGETYGEYTFAGLKFVYQSGATREIGQLNGQPTSTVTLGEWTSVTRLEWCSDSIGIFHIVVRYPAVQPGCFLKLIQALVPLYGCQE